MSSIHLEELKEKVTEAISEWSFENDVEDTSLHITAVVSDGWVSVNQIVTTTKIYQRKETSNDN